MKRSALPLVWLDGEAVARVERDRAMQKRGDGGGFLVGQDFGVGQAAAVVDRDVHELPALLVAAALIALGALAGRAGDAVAGARESGRAF